MSDRPETIQAGPAVLTRAHKLPNAGYNLSVAGLFVAWISDVTADEIIKRVTVPLRVDYENV